MANYIHYWAPLRAGLAFNGQDGAVLVLDNGWFKSLKPADVVWIVTRDGTKIVLVLRFEVQRTEPVESHPEYAIRNSSRFQMTRAYSSPRSASSPRWIPVPLGTIRQLRFATTKSNDRIKQTGSKIFEVELAAMRRLRDETEVKLQGLWESHPQLLWNTGPDQAAEVPGNRFASPETRARVEKAAIHFVTTWHEDRGWIVVSREREGVGFDLECTKGRECRCVEVKGISGDEAVFIMTRGEYGQAKNNPDFLLAIVCNADSKPSVKFVDGKSLLSKYHFEPLSYTVGLAR